MNNLAPPEEFVCWVIFTNGSRTHWWSGFMKAGYRHCYVVYPLKTEGGLFGEDWSVLIDPSTNYMKTQVYKANEWDVMGEIGEFSEALKCRVVNVDATKYSIEVRTCVTLVKLILGVRWCRVQTPWALRNKLLSSGLVVDRI